MDQSAQMLRRAMGQHGRPSSRPSPLRTGLPKSESAGVGEIDPCGAFATTVKKLKMDNGSRDNLQPAQGELKRLVRPWRKLAGGRSPWGLADQVLISGANFTTMVVVGRALGKAGFGEFSLVYNILLLANMIQMSLVTQPHNVIGGGRARGKAYAGYTASTAVSQLIIAAIESVLALIAVAIAHAHGAHCTWLLLALAPAIAAWQLQEFFRRVLYTEGRTAAAFFNDIVSYGGQAVWILWLWQLDRVRGGGGPHLLTGPSALYVLAATSAAAAAIGFFQTVRSTIGAVRFSDALENWHFGKWLLGSELLTYFSSLPMYMNLVGLLVGEAASGELKAAQTLFGPARVISFYLATVLPIQFVRHLTAGGPGAMHLQLKRTAAQVLPALAILCLLIALFAGPLLTIFGRDFASHPRVLAMYAIVAFLTYAQMILIAALTARRLTRVVFFSSVWGAVTTLIFSWVLTRMFGIDGALIGMILTSLVMTATYWLGYRGSLAIPGSNKQFPIPAAEALALCVGTIDANAGGAAG